MTKSTHLVFSVIVSDEEVLTSVFDVLSSSLSMRVQRYRPAAFNPAPITGLGRLVRQMLKPFNAPCHPPLLSVNAYTFVGPPNIAFRDSCSPPLGLYVKPSSRPDVTVTSDNQAA
ncbi:hypothetical protein ONZ45_g19333 [Pleurotus djamor]|nr:hypothetical protein ONZ45_g19333 [Pleurotus djamor]